jgi:subtilisin family serine protease
MLAARVLQQEEPLADPSLDTGIFIAHTDFGGRAVFGANLVPNSTVNADNNGHGT